MCLEQFVANSASILIEPEAITRYIYLKDIQPYLHFWFFFDPRLRISSLSKTESTAGSSLIEDVSIEQTHVILLGHIHSI